jgi:hypothetical protein
MPIDTDDRKLIMLAFADLLPILWWRPPVARKKSAYRDTVTSNLSM